MYSGNNKTALTSQNMIADALMDMMRKQAFSKISISGLCKGAQVSRQTFYSLFKSKENVVKFIFDRGYKFLKDDMGKVESFNYEIMSEKYCEYIIENEEFFRMLITNNLAIVMYDSFKEPFLICNKLKIDDQYVSQELFASYIAGALTSITITFIEKGIPEDIESMKRSVSNLLSINYFS